MSHPKLKNFRRIVVKVGSSLLIDRRGRRSEGPRGSPHSPPTSPSSMVRARTCCVVSSGSIALGRSRLKLPGGAPQAGRKSGRRCCRPNCSGTHLVGSARPSRHRRRSNPRHSARHRRAPPLSQRALHHHQILEWRAVPIINENDRWATNEIRYGDNDRLAARVATMTSSDLLTCCPISTAFIMRRPAPIRMPNSFRWSRPSPPTSRRWRARRNPNCRAAACAPRSRRRRSRRPPARIC